MPKFNTAIAILFVVIFSVAVFFVFKNNSWEKRQNSYIEKVNYAFEGKVISAKELGGVTFLRLFRLKRWLSKKIPCQMTMIMLGCIVETRK